MANQRPYMEGMETRSVREQRGNRSEAGAVYSGYFGPYLVRLCGCQGIEVERTAIAVGVAADWDDGIILYRQLAKAATAEQAASQEGPNLSSSMSVVKPDRSRPAYEPDPALPAPMVSQHSAVRRKPGPAGVKQCYRFPLPQS